MAPPAKGPQAFRTISEAAAAVGVAPHVLRFWETRFGFVRPTTRSGGRRFYRPQDVELLRGVRALLHGDGLSIKDVQRLHREEGIARILAAVRSPSPTTAPSVPRLGESARRRLQAVLVDLERVRDVVDRLLATPRS